MIWSAVAFQMKGFGSVFQCSAHRVIASVRSATEVNTPRSFTRAWARLHGGFGNSAIRFMPATYRCARRRLSTDDHFLVHHQLISLRATAVRTRPDFFSRSQLLGHGSVLLTRHLLASPMAGLTPIALTFKVAVPRRRDLACIESLVLTDMQFAHGAVSEYAMWSSMSCASWRPDPRHGAAAAAPSYAATGVGPQIFMGLAERPRVDETIRAVR